MILYVLLQLLWRRRLGLWSENDVLVLGFQLRFRYSSAAFAEVMNFVVWFFLLLITHIYLTLSSFGRGEAADTIWGGNKMKSLYFLAKTRTRNKTQNSLFKKPFSVVYQRWSKHVVTSLQILHQPQENKATKHICSERRRALHDWFLIFLVVHV